METRSTSADDRRVAELDVCPLDELPPGSVKIVRAGELAVGVYNVGGELLAIEDRCSHDDGPLCEGDWDPDEGVVVCPRHGANIDEQFDVSANGSRVRLARNVGDVVMDLNGVEGIDLTALGGVDQVSVNDLTATGENSLPGLRCRTTARDLSRVSRNSFSPPVQNRPCRRSENGSATPSRHDQERGTSSSPTSTLSIIE